MSLSLSIFKEARRRIDRPVNSTRLGGREEARACALTRFSFLAHLLPPLFYFLFSFSYYLFYF